MENRELGAQHLVLARAGGGLRESEFTGGSREGTDLLRAHEHPCVLQPGGHRRP